MLSMTNARRPFFSIFLNFLIKIVDFFFGPCNLVPFFICPTQFFSFGRSGKSLADFVHVCLPKNRHFLGLNSQFSTSLAEIDVTVRHRSLPTLLADEHTTPKQVKNHASAR